MNEVKENAFYISKDLLVDWVNGKAELTQLMKARKEEFGWPEDAKVELGWVDGLPSIGARLDVLVSWEGSK